MRTYLLSILCAISLLSSAQENEIKISTKAQAVTIFLDGAQVARNKILAIPQGKSTLIFNKLSPYIDDQSIQFRTSADIKILSIKSKKNYSEKTKRSKELELLEQNIETLNDKIKLQETYLSVVYKEIEFLSKNMDISGKNNQTTLNNLQQTSKYIIDNFSKLKLKELEYNKIIKDLEKERQLVYDKIKTIIDKQLFPTGEIIVKVSSEKDMTSPVELLYNVANVNWIPTYDIKASNITAPLEITYKAIVRQDCKENWDNVNLTFSTSDPSTSIQAPKLKKYNLDYYTNPPIYTKLKSQTITGHISDKSGSIIGAQVSVEGSNISTFSDEEGYYAITVPQQATQLNFDFIGYHSKSRIIDNNTIDVNLKPAAALNEISFSAPLEEALQEQVAGVRITKSHKRKPNTKAKAYTKTEDQTLNVQQKTNRINAEFVVDKPYTIASSSKSYTVDLTIYHIPADYTYYCVPKIDNDAFLIAYLNEWEQYRLLDGEANIYFEDTYVGKTLLELNTAKDTLELSLGRDKNVVVSRNKVHNYKSKQLIGTKRKESRIWEISIKNNKDQNINLTLLDQIPVSTNQEIEVHLLEKSGAKVNDRNGEIQWRLNIKPKQSKKVSLKYEVEYPKNRTLNIE